jgi:hypothetical protein
MTPTAIQSLKAHPLPQPSPKHVPPQSAKGSRFPASISVFVFPGKNPDVAKNL